MSVLIIVITYILNWDAFQSFGNWDMHMETGTKETRKRTRSLFGHALWYDKGTRLSYFAQYASGMRVEMRS